MRANLGCLSNEHRVNIVDAAAALFNLARGFFEENFTGCVFPLRIAGREKGTDVALANRAEYRIANCVHQHIGIRMPIEAGVVREGDAAENERPSGLELMHIVSNSHAIHGRSVVESKGRAKAMS